MAAQATDHQDQHARNIDFSSRPGRRSRFQNPPLPGPEQAARWKWQRRGIPVRYLSSSHRGTRATARCQRQSMYEVRSRFSAILCSHAGCVWVCSFVDIVALSAGSVPLRQARGLMPTSVLQHFDRQEQPEDRERDVEDQQRALPSFDRGRPQIDERDLFQQAFLAESLRPPRSYPSA